MFIVCLGFAYLENNQDVFAQELGFFWLFCLAFQAQFGVGIMVLHVSYYFVHPAYRVVR